MKTKRPWNRAEKWLFSAPLLFAIAAVGAWLWRRAMPVFIEVPGNNFQAIEFSPDGSKLLVVFNDSKTSIYYHRVYDLDSRRKICDLAIPARPIRAPNPKFFAGKPFFYWPSWSPDGTRIAAGYSDGSRGTTKIPHRYLSNRKPAWEWNSVSKFAIWDAQTGRITGDYLYAPPNVDSRSNVHFSSDGKTLVGYGVPPAVFDAATGQRRRVLSGQFQTVQGVKTNVALGLVAEQNNAETQFQVFDLKSKRVVWNPRLGRVFQSDWCGEVLGVRASGQSITGKRLFKTDSLLLWNAKTRTVMPSPPVSDRLYFLSFSPDRSTLVYLDGDFRPLPRPTDEIRGALVLWDYRLHRVVRRVPLASGWRWIEWSPDGNWLSIIANETMSLPSRLLIFDRTGKLHLERKESFGTSRWAPDGSRLAIASNGSNLSGKIEIIRFEK